MLALPSSSTLAFRTAIVVVRDVRERWSPLHIAEGVDAWRSGFQPVVDRDVAVFVSFDPRGGQVEVLGVGHAAHRQE